MKYVLPLLVLVVLGYRAVQSKDLLHRPTMVPDYNGHWIESNYYWYRDHRLVAFNQADFYWLLNDHLDSLLKGHEKYWYNVAIKNLFKRIKQPGLSSAMYSVGDHVTIGLPGNPAVSSLDSFVQAVVMPHAIYYYKHLFPDYSPGNPQYKHIHCFYFVSSANINNSHTQTVVYYEINMNNLSRKYGTSTLTNETN